MIGSRSIVTPKAGSFLRRLAFILDIGLRYGVHDIERPLLVTVSILASSYLDP